MTKLSTSKLLLNQHLFLLKIAHGTLIKKHITSFNYILLELKNIYEGVEEEDQASLLLCSLSLTC